MSGSSYRFSGIAPEVMRDVFLRASAQQGKTLQNWVGSACNSQALAQEELTYVLAVSRSVAMAHGIPPEVFFSLALRSYCAHFLNQPRIEDIALQVAELTVDVGLDQQFFTQDGDDDHAKF